MDIMDSLGALGTLRAHGTKSLQIPRAPRYSEPSGNTVSPDQGSQSPPRTNYTQGVMSTLGPQIPQSPQGPNMLKALRALRSPWAPRVPRASKVSSTPRTHWAPLASRALRALRAPRAPTAPRVPRQSVKYCKFGVKYFPKRPFF